MPATPKRGRGHLTPPHADLTALRKAAGLTMDALCVRINQEFPELKVKPGTISAIENGHRGASQQMLNAICAAFRIPPGSLTTDYAPKARGPKSPVVAA